MAEEQRQSINNDGVANCEDLDKNVQGEDGNIEGNVSKIPSSSSMLPLKREDRSYKKEIISDNKVSMTHALKDSFHYHVPPLEKKAKLVTQEILNETAYGEWSSSEESDNHTKIFGVWEKNACLTYSLKPVICTVDRVLSVALMTDVYLQMNLFLKVVEQDNRCSKFSNLHHTFNSITCRRPDTITIAPMIENDDSTIKMEPAELTFDVKDVVQDDDPSYNSFEIKGSVTTSPVDVTFFIWKNDVLKQKRVVSIEMEIDSNSAGGILLGIKPTKAEQWT